MSRPPVSSRGKFKKRSTVSDILTESVQSTSTFDRRIIFIRPGKLDDLLWFACSSVPLIGSSPPSASNSSTMMQRSEASSGGRLHSRKHQHHHSQTAESRTFRLSSREARECLAGDEHPQPCASRRQCPDGTTALPVDSSRARASGDQRNRRPGPRGRRAFAVNPQSSRLSCELLTSSESCTSKPVENVDDGGAELAANEESEEDGRDLESREVDAKMADVSLRLAVLQGMEKEPELEDEELGLNDQQQEDEVFFHRILFDLNIRVGNF